MTSGLALIVASMLTSASASASAEPAPGPDAPPAAGSPPASEEVAFRREGFAIGVSAGPALIAGLGELDQYRGVGGGLSLRFGTTASSRLLWILQLDAAGYLVAQTNEVTGEKSTSYTNSSMLTLGGQYYLRDAWWLRGGIGVAAFILREKPFGDTIEATRRGGLGCSFTTGADLFRRGIFALDVETMVGAAIYDGSVLTQAALLLAANWY